MKYKKYTWIGASGTIYYGIKQRFLWFFWNKMDASFTRQNEAEAAINALNKGLAPRGGFGANKTDPNKPPKPPISFKW